MIECENLVKIYTQPGTRSQPGMEVVALQGLDLSVADGEMIGIVGESGSGKTTLLNVLGGLDRPSAGKATVGDRDLLKMTERELDDYRRAQVGFVWQQTTRNLVPYLTALENIELPMRLKVFDEGQRRARARELLETVGMESRMRHFPGQLSGGEQQRVAIAVALANQPPLLLADEPTGELDTSTASNIYETLRKINQVLGTTVVIVSHDAEISRQVNRVVMIRDGKTSAETVRVETALPIDAGQEEKPQPVFEESLMLDSAGRVQIPRDVLDTLGIGRRVRMEIKEGGVLLLPVDGHRRAAVSTAEETGEEAVFIVDEPLAGKKTVSLLQRVRQFFRRGKR